MDKALKPQLGWRTVICHGSHPSLIVNADLEELLFTTLQPWETLVQWH